MRFPALGAYVGPDIVAGLLATGLTLTAHPPVHRRRHELRDRARLVGAGVARLRRRARRSRRQIRADARRGRRDRGRHFLDADLELTVIGDVEPVGLCGSGLVDAVAELWAPGVIDQSGRYGSAEERPAKIGEEHVFFLADDVYPLAARCPRVQ